MLKKLKIKFVVIMMLIFSVMLLLVFGLVYGITKGNQEQSSVAMMQGIAMNPLHMAMPGEASLDVQLPYFTVQVDEQGDLAATGGGYYDLSDEELLRELVSASYSAESTVGVLEEYNLRFYRMDEGDLHILVFADLSSERATLQNLLRSFAVIGAISFLIFLVISIFLAEWTVRPVDAAWRQQKQFVADASHELKTPLTIITTDAEILLNPDYGEAAHRQCAEAILAKSGQMSDLIKGLLDLARADRGRSDMLMERLDLSELLQNAVLPFEPVFYERGLKFITGIQPRIYVHGSTAHLEQVVSILLDNAQKYALPQEPVYLKLWLVNRKRCRLTVSNACEPMEQAELENIFKRFYRLDKSRANAGGYGLGLSIADTIVRAHRGRIWASCQNGVIQFQVELSVCR